jgi:hypothetical protein
VTSIVVADPAVQADAEIQDPVDGGNESKIPDKFKGKSLEEVVAAYQELESTKGRLANEVGQLRRLTDTALGFARESRAAPVNQPAQKPTTTTEDLLADPTKAVTELAKHEANERVAATEQRQANLEAQLNLERFARKHPDFESTMHSPEFQGWLQKSAYRQGLAMKAASNDFDAADELFGLYQESGTTAPAKETKETPDPSKAARQATLVKRGGSSAAGVGANGDTSKGKIYSRSELVDMRINKPEEFEARYAAEFLPAYREGRVK